MKGHVRNLRRLAVPLFAGFLAFAVFSCSEREASAEPAYVSIGTGAVSGVYYPTGRVICDAVNASLRTSILRCSAEATPGSVYNVEALLTGEIDFAMVQSDVQYLAVTGKMRWSGHPAEMLRSVMSLYPELVTIIARPDAGITDIEGLRGKRVNIGAPGSGTRATWAVLEKALGFTHDDLAEAAELTPDAAADRMCAGKLDASILITGHPSKMVDAELSSCRLTLIPIGASSIDRLVAANPNYARATIPAEMYGLAIDTATFGGKTTLLTSAAVPEEIVYQFTKAMMKNLARLKAQQPSLAGLNPEDMARQSLSAPLHPGAERAYRELGLSK